MTRLAKPKTDAAPVEPIKRGEAYPLATFRHRSGLQNWSIRQLRKRGFPVRRVAGRAFILGDDWIDWLSKAEAPQ